MTGGYRVITPRLGRRVACRQEQPAYPPHRSGLRLIAALLLTALTPLTQAAQRLPAWEVGLGLGVLSLPFYRGAAEGRGYILPFPYFKYRGPYLQVDEEGLHGKLFSSDRLRLDISLAAGVPVPDSPDGPRVGMPRLNSTVELGPQLEYRLWQARASRREIGLHLPLRAVFSVNIGAVDDQGWVFAPFIEYKSRNGAPGGPWTFAVGAGPLFATGAYHDYFYEVLPGQATPARPEYHSEPGYSGSRMTFKANKRIGDWWLGAFARVDDLRGAVFTDSPLVQREFYYAVGLAVSRLLTTSRTTVEIK